MNRLVSTEIWQAYVAHPFVAQLSAGTLPEACFRHYLGQDYLFLIQFARAHALAAYKADALADIRAAAAGMSAIIDTEIGLHVDYCAGWGLDQDDMQALPEASATIAYSRYVLEKGLQGDLLDLYVALAPCVIGYGEIGARLAGNHVPARLRIYLALVRVAIGRDNRMVFRIQVRVRAHQKVRADQIGLAGFSKPGPFAHD